MNESHPDLSEHCISTQTLASGQLLTLHCDQVRLPDGNESQREYVTHPGAVVIVPLLANGKVVLLRQFRYALRQVFIELPAGKIDLEEDYASTGPRELREETGFTATDWVYLGRQHPCIGYSDEVIHMYLARDLNAGQYQPDADEALQVFEIDFSESLNMIARGEITDGKTIIALLRTEKYLQAELRKNNG
jgi:ADP-ribose pyrophosphatase